MRYNDMLSKLMEQVELSDENIAIFDALKSMNPEEYKSKYDQLAESFRKRWGEPSQRQDTYFETKDEPSRITIDSLFEEVKDNE